MPFLSNAIDLMNLLGLVLLIAGVYSLTKARWHVGLELLGAGFTLFVVAWLFRLVRMAISFTTMIPTLIIVTLLVIGMLSLTNRKKDR